MSLQWEGEERDRIKALEAARTRDRLLENIKGEPIVLGNEFSEVRVLLIETRNGLRLMIEVPSSGQWVTLDPLELEALTWQTPATFSAMVGEPFAPLFWEDQ
ncbi:hypothetical protein FEF27_12600 [Nesterenkonia sphaerica]|uniref:Dihydrodiol dehydrogenase n=1 Tax=Nesterenkonia sphaerica TaxID=1804988 RepID=A0A5R8ZXP1_9MICC|nr:hypothetical protein FEF27_12600 [Nesterenkonia sphaerica]